VILDTNAVSALIDGEAAIGEILSVADQHHLPLVVIAEYQFGLLASQRKGRLRSLFRRLEADSFVLYPDRETADWYAGIRNDLKLQGTPIPESDLWIAALSRQYSLQIVSRDPHFDHVEHVRRVTW
jgi:tRNA(fMet)-specific endonuclease VapC